MRFHLVSYATLIYRHRQILLAASGKTNGIVASADSWTPGKLIKSGFPDLAPDISLHERGSGFWAWKPFVIQHALHQIPDGDVVLYCDAGRKYPYILLDRPLDGFVRWMDSKKQDIMPGIYIPWNGPMSMWTKNDAFAGTGVDDPSIRAAAPIQASFSLWRSCRSTKAFVSEWLNLCIQRRLVSDDPSESAECANFKAHRHDQSLLNICCHKHGIVGLDIGAREPSYNERDPSQVAANLFGEKMRTNLLGRTISLLAQPIQSTEKALRGKFCLGKTYD